ncbi:MAG: cytochrome c biogenesis protein CcsA [Saprospiraceae bacterium]
MNLKKNWWKYIGIICLIYTVTAGLLVPLKPGILEVSESRLYSGSTVSLDIIGYNTHFLDGRYSAFIRMEKDKQIKSSIFKAQDNQRASLLFEIPNDMPSGSKVTDVTLVINNTKHGYSIYPNLRILKSKNHNDENKAQWTNLMNVSEVGWKFAFPYRNILIETIRNTFFHVAIWMAQFVLLTIALIYSIFYLRKAKSIYDHNAAAFTYISIVFGVIGVISGSLWARFTWGTFWTNDVKLNMVAISMMIYLAYGILRSSIDDIDKKAKSSAIYNIFAFCAMIPLIMIIPRLTDSLHPGNGGNPAFGNDDMDNTLRMVFYPAIIGLALLGGWIAQIVVRVKKVEEKIINEALND